MICRVLLTRDGRVLDEPYLTPPLPWQRADEGDLEKLAEQASEQLIAERHLRNYDADAPNGFQIVNEKSEVVKAERLF